MKDRIYKYQKGVNVMEKTNGIEVRVGNEGEVSRAALSVLKGFKRYIPVKSWEYFSNWSNKRITAWSIWNWAMQMQWLKLPFLLLI